MKYLFVVLMSVAVFFATPNSRASDEYSKYLNALGKKGTIYRIINKESGKLIGIKNCSLKNGANVRQWELTGEQCQNWLLFPISNKDYVIINNESKKLLGIEKCSFRNGANIRQWEYTGETCQKWKIKPAVQGYFYLIPRHSNKMAGVKHCSNSNGANIRQWEYTGEECQMWKLQPVGQIDLGAVPFLRRIIIDHYLDF